MGRHTDSDTWIIEFLDSSDQEDIAIYSNVVPAAQSEHSDGMTDDSHPTTRRVEPRDYGGSCSLPELCVEPASFGTPPETVWDIVVADAMTEGSETPQACDNIVFSDRYTASGQWVRQGKCSGLGCLVWAALQMNAGLTLADSQSTTHELGYHAYVLTWLCRQPWDTLSDFHRAELVEVVLQAVSCTKAQFALDTSQSLVELYAVLFRNLPQVSWTVGLTCACCHDPASRSISTMMASRSLVHLTDTQSLKDSFEKGWGEVISEHFRSPDFKLAAPGEGPILEDPRVAAVDPANHRFLNSARLCDRPPPILVVALPTSASFSPEHVTYTFELAWTDATSAPPSDSSYGPRRKYELCGVIYKFRGSVGKYSSRWLRSKCNEEKQVLSFEPEKADVCGECTADGAMWVMGGVNVNQTAEDGEKSLHMLFYRWSTKQGLVSN